MPLAQHPNPKRHIIKLETSTNTSPYDHFLLGLCGDKLSLISKGKHVTENGRFFIKALPAKLNCRNGRVVVGKMHPGNELKICQSTLGVYSCHYYDPPVTGAFH